MYLFPVAVATDHKDGSLKEKCVTFLEARGSSMVFLVLLGGSRENQFLPSLYVGDLWLIEPSFKSLKTALFVLHSFLLGCACGISCSLL